MEVFKVSLDRFQQNFLEQIVLTFPVEVFKALAQSQGSASSSSSLDHAGQGVFRTFRRGKKCGVRSALEVGTECGLQSIHGERSSNAS